MQLTVLLLCMCKQMVEQAESVRCGLLWCTARVGERSQ